MTVHLAQAKAMRKRWTMPLRWEHLAKLKQCHLWRAETLLQEPLLVAQPHSMQPHGVCRGLHVC